METSEIKEKVRVIIINEFIGEEEAGELEDTTPLISGGIIDSISTLQLVDQLENTFGINVQAHEVDEENLDNIKLITSFVESKQSS